MSDVTTTSPVEIGDGIMAMTEDDGTVVTLLKRDPETGAVYRQDGEWKPLVDPTVLDNLTFVGVSASAEAVYDRYLGEDKLVSIGHYFPSPDGPFWPHPVQEYEEPETAAEAAEARRVGGDEEEAPPGVDAESEEDESIAASAILSSIEDLPDAIAAAVLDPNLRWYVERRIAALGLEADLPWQRN